MAQEQEFLKKVMTDSSVKELMKEIENTHGDEEAAEKLVRAAKKMGFDISKEKFLELIHLKEAVQREKTQNTETKVKTALDEEALDAVSGGDSICADTYQPGENCWFVDQCDIVLRSYDEQPAVPVTADENDCKEGYIRYEYEDWVIGVENINETDRLDGGKNKLEPDEFI